MKNGYLKIGAYTPEVKVCDVDFNTEAIINGINEALVQGVEVLAFPELSLTSKTAGELLNFSSMREKVYNAIRKIAHFTVDKEILVFVGAPYYAFGKTYSSVFALNKGRVLAIVPKGYSKEIYEDVDFMGEEVPFGNRIIFKNCSQEKQRIGVEIGEDLFEVIPTSSYLVKEGANIIINCSAFEHTADSSERILSAVKEGAERLSVSYLLCNAGEGESTTDEVYSGYSLIVEGGEVLAKRKYFDKGLITATVDLDASFTNTESLCEVEFSVKNDFMSDRIYDKNPFIPKGKSELDAMWRILDIQAEGLKKRLLHTNSKKLVLGLSGGLDSTLALLVAMRTMNKLERSLKDIIAVTMPCFGTTSRTLDNSIALAKICGVILKKIDVSKSVTRHLKDIGHSGSKYDAAFENAQARERTQVLMDLANMEGGIVVGTGDMSELALGWATYNGDHMSMYGVNAGVPKTLVKFMVRVYAENSKPKLRAVLLDIVGTPVSPELIPSGGEEISQKTEDLVGPYTLHDFYLYHLIYKKLSPKKVYYMAVNTFKGEFDEVTIKKWLETFIRRFFSQQFKRSCLPDGVKVFDFSLSPRKGFKMPSDALSTVWLEELKSL